MARTPGKTSLEASSGRISAAGLALRRIVFLLVFAAAFLLCFMVCFIVVPPYAGGGGRLVLSFRRTRTLSWLAATAATLAATKPLVSARKPGRPGMGLGSARELEASAALEGASAVLEGAATIAPGLPAPVTAAAAEVEVVEEVVEDPDPSEAKDPAKLCGAPENNFVSGEPPFKKLQEAWRHLAASLWEAANDSWESPPSFGDRRATRPSPLQTPILSGVLISIGISLDRGPPTGPGPSRKCGTPKACNKEFKFVKLNGSRRLAASMIRLPICSPAPALFPAKLWNPERVAGDGLGFANPGRDNMLVWPIIIFELEWEACTEEWVNLHGTNLARLCTISGGNGQGTAGGAVLYAALYQASGKLLGIIGKILTGQA